MEAINLRKHRNKFVAKKKYFRYFITRTENRPPANLDVLAAVADRQVWKEINCLSCANCCKKMSPTFTRKDIERISAHLEMSPEAFKAKWLYYDKKDRDWMNKSQPCQFLDLKTNMCSIYEVRPEDCASFPHLVKKPATDYFYIHKQNIEYCPATLSFVEKMIASVKGQKSG